MHSGDVSFLERIRFVLIKFNFTSDVFYGMIYADALFLNGASAFIVIMQSVQGMHGHKRTGA